jgi:hypothetical protein
VYGFYRVSDREEAVVILNVGTSVTSLQVDVSELRAKTFIQAWPCDKGRVHVNHGGRLDVTLPARDALVLVSENRGAVHPSMEDGSLS